MKNSVEEIFKKQVAGFNRLPRNINWNANKGWEQYTSLEKKLKRRKIFIHLSSVAAILLIAIVSTFIVISKNEAYYIGNTTNAALLHQLPNGNKVWLNKNSSITYTGNNYSINGEAYFEIINEITIEAGNALITSDVESNFNIKAFETDDHISIIVGKGMVKIYDKQNVNGLTTLVPKGNYCTFHKYQKLIFSTTNQNNNYLAWKTGKLEFNNQTMATVSEILAQYYNTEVDFKDISVAYCQFTGSFENKDINTVLNKIQNDLNIEIEITGNKITFSGKGCL